MDNISFSSAIQPPSVFISSTTNPIVGKMYTLSCFATYEEFLQATPTLTWMLPGTTDDTTIGDQSNAEDMSSISLNFNPLRTSHGGVYVCESTVNISGITPQRQTANETVRVQSKFIIKVYI